MTDCLRLVLSRLPLLEVTWKVASTFPYKNSNPSLTTHLSGANPAADSLPLDVYALDNFKLFLKWKMNPKVEKIEP